jgi:hypothetical protein
VVARIVHGNKVKAELLPWHFKANILKTTLRFVELLNVFGSALSTFAVWQHEPQDLLSIAAQQSGFLGPIVFGLEAFLSACFSQHAFRGSQQVDLASAVPSPTLEPIGFLLKSFSSRAGLWAYEGGVTPFSSAQASRSAGVKQQQLVQHCSAVLHPQGQFWQGKGWELSLSRRSKVAIGMGIVAAQKHTRTRKVITFRPNSPRPFSAVIPFN